MSKKKSKLQKDINQEINDFYNNIKSDAIENLRLRKKFKNKKQKELYNIILKNQITFINGPAGTGKSLVALMTAIHMLMTKKYDISKITLSKPIVEAAKSIGYLKGDLSDKTEVYYNSFYDNFKKLIGTDGIKLLKENNLIEHVIINFIRGNTFGEYDENGKPLGYITILDEAQNVSVGELRTFISRIGDDKTKMIILGDSDQCDVKMKPGELNGLEWAFENLQDINNIGFFSFDENDIVRSKILIEIMKRFKLYS